MTWIRAAILSILCLQLQDPQSPQAPESPQDPKSSEETGPSQEPQLDVPGGGRDVVILKSGERFEGSIVVENDESLMIRLDARMVVGFSMSKILSVERGVQTTAGGTEAGPVRGLGERDQWFVLHNGEGWPVGWLHSSVTRDDENRTRIDEEWEFTQDRRRTNVKILEVLAEDRTPLSCYYHEWSTVQGDERIHDERIVEGEVQEGRLSVQRRSLSDHTESEYEFPDGTRFPLELTEQLRQDLGGTAEGDVYRVFDPRVDEFAMRNLGVGRWRDVEIDGRVVRVRELVAETAGGSNAEWLNASTMVLRREINGMALVAVPSTEESARRQATAGSQVFPSALRSEPDKRFALWLPNPLWSFEEQSMSGQVIARSRIHDAQASVVLLDYMDPGLLLESVADAVVKLHKLMNSQFELRLRSPVRVRDREAVRLEGVHSEGRVKFRSVIHIMPCGESFAVLTCKTPEDSYEELAPDFERMLNAVELDRQGVEPKAPELLRIKRSHQAPR